MKVQTITRVWHGVTRAEHADAYLEYIVATGIEDYKKTDGNLGVEFESQFDEFRRCPRMQAAAVADHGLTPDRRPVSNFGRRVIAHRASASSCDATLIYLRPAS